MQLQKDQPASDERTAEARIVALVVDDERPVADEIARQGELSAVVERLKEGDR